ncbi:MAG: type II secretion system F family protein [Candidatus Kerfeldbacteria bacterium]|nr:type II secretion system F family protein [Candidatus Kerfeldbacteria bacterium]
MPQFTYQAKDQAGRSIEGELDAPSLTVAQEMLREKNLIVIFLQEQGTRRIGFNWKRLTERVKTKDVVVFSRQLAVLISATVPIVRALRILAKQTESPVLRRVITDVANEVDGGARLSSSLHRHSHIFDDFFVYMIRAGETTGQLDDVLTYLADQKEKDYALVSRMISALIYPAFIVVVLVGIFIFMMIYVLPKLLDVVASSGAQLPWATRALITVSTAFQQYWWVLLSFVVILIVVYTVLRSRPQGQYFLDRGLLHIPVIGNIFRKIYLARMSRSMANLLAAGVPVNRSIEIISDIVGNATYKQILLQVRKDVEAGHSLSSALGKSKYIPPMMTQMMNVGEETGRLDQILTKVADFYTGEVNSLTGALVSLIEPVIIILLGAGILVLVLGILMPIYAITAQF